MTLYTYHSNSLGIHTNSILSCPFQMYDRFNRLGVCLSHQQQLNILDEIGAGYKREIIDNVQRGLKFQITGDNLDLRENVRQMLLSNRNRDHHWFTLILYFDRIDFSELDNTKPQGNLHDVPPSLFIPNQVERSKLRSDFIILVSRIITKHLQQFEHLSSVVPSHIVHRFSEEMKKKSKVYNLPIQFKDEKKYSDMIDIQSFIEEFVATVSNEADQQCSEIPFGGDELTRIRAQKAKYIRCGGHTNADRLEHVNPILIENWHTKRAYLAVLWQQLYKQESSRDKGTLKYYRELLQRNNIPADVNKNFDAVKQFLTLVVKCFVIEGALEFFEMESTAWMDWDDVA